MERSPAPCMYVEDWSKGTHFIAFAISNANISTKTLANTFFLHSQLKVKYILCYILKIRSYDWKVLSALWPWIRDMFNILWYREIFKKPGFHAVCYIGSMPRLVQIEAWFFGIIHCITRGKKSEEHDSLQCKLFCTCKLKKGNLPYNNHMSMSRCKLELNRTHKMKKVKPAFKRLNTFSRLLVRI